MRKICSVSLSLFPDPLGNNCRDNRQPEDIPVDAGSLCCRDFAKTGPGRQPVSLTRARARTPAGLVFEYFRTGQCPGAAADARTPASKFIFSFSRRLTFTCKRRRVYTHIRASTHLCSLLSHSLRQRRRRSNVRLEKGSILLSGPMGISCDFCAYFNRHPRARGREREKADDAVYTRIRGESITMEKSGLRFQLSWPDARRRWTRRAVRLCWGL